MHKKLTGLGRGNIQILFQNTEENEIFVIRISGSFAMHLYWYLLREKGYLLWCCLKMLYSWFAV
jgi:hypothetical protein